MIDVMLCVGHSRRGDKCGAVSVYGEDEYSYNSLVAVKTAWLLDDHGISAEVISDYPYKGYSAAMRWVGQKCYERSAKLAVELHFNSASRAAACGHEWLIYEGSAGGEKVARSFERTMIAHRPEAQVRGVKELSSPKQNGYGFVYHTPCPAVVLEPFFGSNAQESSEFIPHPEVLAGIYAEAIRSCLSS